MTLNRILSVDAPEGSWHVDRGLAALDAALAGQNTRLARTDAGSAALELRLAADAGLSAEGYRLEQHPVAGAVITRIVAADAVGARYALSDLAEHLRAGGEVATAAARTSAPRFLFRAVKFNLPWMSYRQHPSLQLHDQTCRDLGFWAGFLDMMADNRFNVLSLWSQHPFHLLVRPIGFPEAWDLDDAEFARWQGLWRGLFALAKERGIATYLVNWNIFVSPGFARAHGLAYSVNGGAHFGDGDRTAMVKRFTRTTITQVIDEYPDLDGLGITLGERMGGMNPQEREDWMLETIAAGITAAKRPIRFIHRGPLSADKGSGGSTSDEAICVTRAGITAMQLDAPAIVELKYNWSHGHSTPRLRIVHGGAIKDGYWNPPPVDYRLAWTVRNEDFFVLRWGEPGFIREFLANNGQAWVAGCFIGSECSIPAAEYVMRPEAKAPWRHAYERQWLFWRLWGRLLHDPATPDRVFSSDFDQRYGPGTGAALLPAFAHACRMPLRLASFMSPTWDFTLYAEGFLAVGEQRKAFISIEDMITVTPLESDLIGIGEFVANGACAGRITPLQLADELDRDGAMTLTLIEPFAQTGGNLVFELADLRAWAALSRYFAAKLRGAVALARFRCGHGSACQSEALAHLEAALLRWDEVIAAAAPMHPEIPLIHTEQTPFAWSLYRRDVVHDLELVRGATAPQ